jgi:hypothetical protein
VRSASITTATACRCSTGRFTNRIAQLRTEFEALPDNADRQPLQIGASGR